MIVQCMLHAVRVRACCVIAGGLVASALSPVWMNLLPAVVFMHPVEPIVDLILIQVCGKRTRHQDQNIFVRTTATVYFVNAVL